MSTGDLRRNQLSNIKIFIFNLPISEELMLKDFKLELGSTIEIFDQDLKAIVIPD